MKYSLMRTAGLLASALVLAASAAPAEGIEYFLRADVTTLTMPDGTGVKMWGWALDSAFGAGDGVVTVPGPMLTIPVGDTALTIHVDNNLTAANILPDPELGDGVPVSLVIPGLKTPMSPVFHPPGSPYAGRVRSFTHETSPGNTTAITYTWNNVRPGSYIYHSGTHPQVQVQMGLYGGVRKLHAAGQAYPGSATHAREIQVFLSEIDPALHAAVSTGNYGPGKAMTSTVDYKPRYFLINGQPYSAASVPVNAGNPRDRVLLRLFNAGLREHTLILADHRLVAIAEDAFPYANTSDIYACLLPAMKTRDVLVQMGRSGEYALFDRSGNLTNHLQTPGGMLMHLKVRDRGIVGSGGGPKGSAASAATAADDSGSKSAPEGPKKVATGAGPEKTSASPSIGGSAGGEAGTEQSAEEGAGPDKETAGKSKTITRAAPKKR